MNIKEIRELAKKYTPEQIEECIAQQIKKGKNICLEDFPTEDEVLNELSKAGFVREQMEKGMDLADALRELAARIRRLQTGDTAFDK